MSWPLAYDACWRMPNQRGLAVELRRRPVAHSLEEAAELLGIRPSDMAKTIVVRRSSGSYLFAVIPGDTQIAWPKLRLLLGVSKMKLPDAAEALDGDRLRARHDHPDRQ